MNWDWIVLLPILAFVALAAGLAVVFRRTGSIVAKTREAEGFRSSVRDLAARIDASLEGAVDPDRPGPPPRADARRHRRDAHGRVGCGRPLPRGGAGAARAIDGRRHPRRPRRAARAGRPGPRDGRARGDHHVDDPRRSQRARGADLDQARLPEPPPRPGGDRPRGQPRRRPGRRRATTPCSGMLGLHHNT